MYTLYARAGWGSALIETQLAWYGLPYQLEDIGDLFKEKAAGEKLRLGSHRSWRTCSMAC